MLTRNVHYAEQPERVIVTCTEKGERATVEFPLDVEEVEREESTEYVAAEVYSMQTRNVPGLKERVLDNYDEWLEMAKKPEPQKTELSDVIEAINVLTDLILGGE